MEYNERIKIARVLVGKVKKELDANFCDYAIVIDTREILSYKIINCNFNELGVIDDSIEDHSFVASYCAKVEISFSNNAGGYTSKIFDLYPFGVTINENNPNEFRISSSITIVKD